MLVIQPHLSLLESIWKRTTEDPTAFFTFWVAAFTFVLAITSIKASSDTRKLIDLTHQTLILTQRPRLRVSNVVVIPPNPALVTRPRIFQPNHPVKGQLSVANVGGSRARINESHCIVFWSDAGLPMRRPYEDDVANNVIPATVLEPGQSILGNFRSDEILSDRADTIGTQVARGLHLYVMGWIEYVDDREIVRRSRFCREFQRREGPFIEGRFYAVQDPDYEHEDR